MGHDMIILMMCCISMREPGSLTPKRDRPFSLPFAHRGKKRQNIYFFHSVFRAQYLRFLNVCSRYTVTLCECCQHLVLTERSDEYFIVETITGTITMHICHTLAQTDGERADIRVECVSGRCHIFSDSKWFD